MLQLQSNRHKRNNRYKIYTLYIFRLLSKDVSDLILDN
jgi:hypothetical protein